MSAVHDPVYVVSNPDSAEYDYVFREESDALEFIAARWPDCGNIIPEELTIIDHPTAVEMIREEQKQKRV